MYFYDYYISISVEEESDPEHSGFIRSTDPHHSGLSDPDHSGLSNPDHSGSNRFVDQEEDDDDDDVTIDGSGSRDLGPPDFIIKPDKPDLTGSDRTKPDEKMDDFEEEEFIKEINEKLETDEKLETEESQTEKEEVLKENKGKENICSVIKCSYKTSFEVQYCCYMTVYYKCTPVKNLRGGSMRFLP